MAIIEVSKQITNYLDSEQTASAPANPVEGQRWTDTSKSPPVAMIYKDGEWKAERLSVEVLDPDFYQDLEDTKTEVATAVEKAEAAEKAGKDAQAAGEAARSAASEAKQAGENAANLATQATLDAQAAKDKADAIQIDVNGLVSDVATINGTVTAISSKANEAYEKATAVEGRTATLETSVTGLTGRMTDVETTSTSTTKKLNELVVTVDGQKQTLATTTTTANSALSKANVLETTVDGVTRTISSVQEWQDNLKIGATNILTKSNESDRTVVASNNGTTYPIRKSSMTENGINFVRVSRNTTVAGSTFSIFNTIQVAYMEKEIREKGYVTVSYMARSSSDATFQIMATSYGASKNSTANNHQSYVDVTTEWKRYSSTFTSVPSDASGIRVLPSVLTKSSSYDLETFYLDLAQYQIEMSTVASDWGIAESERATVTQVNTISETVDGHTQLIASTKTTADSALSKATQAETTANGLKTTISSVETTANSALSKALQVEATASGITQTVVSIQEDLNSLSETTSSQFTQLSDQMNFKLTSSDGGVTQIDMQNQVVTISSENIYLTGKSNISDAIIKTAHIADLAVSNGKIANLAVTEGKIGNLAVTTAKIADLAVNNAKISSLDAAKINTGYLAAARIAASSITTDKLNVATLSAITADLGNVTAGTINGLEIIGGSYTQSATMTDPNSGKSGISEIKIASGVLTNSFNSTDSSVSRQTTLSSGVLRFLNLGSEFGRLQSNSDKGSSTVPALEISGTFVAITSSQRGWINLSANGIFEGNTYSGYSVDAGSNTGNYVGFNRNSSDKMNFFAGKTADGTKRMGSDDLYASSGSGKALHITSGGSIVAYSSSERFKEYIETASDVNPKSLLNLDLKSWIYKSSHSLVSVGEPIRRVYGLIAEDVERVGLNQYVERDINGRVEGYKPELWTVTIPILKEHEESIETLKQKVQKLEEEIEALQAA